MLKRPEEDEVRWVVTLVAVLVATTVALGIAAPVESVTVPVMAPAPAVWALSNAGRARGSVTANRRSALESLLARPARRMLSLDFMVTSIEISSVITARP